MPAAVPILVEDSEPEDEDAGGPAPPVDETAPGKRKRRATVVLGPRKKAKAKNAPAAPPAPVAPVGTLEEHLAAIRRLAQEAPELVARIKQLERQNLALSDRNVVLADRNEMLAGQNATLAGRNVTLADEKETATTDKADAQRLLVQKTLEADRLERDNARLLHPSPLPGECTNCMANGEDGVICSGAAGHAICIDCLANFASMDAATKDMRLDVNGDLRLRCTGCVGGGFEGWNLVRATEHAHGQPLMLFLAAFQHYTDRAKFREEKLAVARANVEVPTPQERILTSIEAICAQTCPGGCPWTDHDACLVLFCDPCGAKFCALCDGYLTPTQDGHAHVANCQVNPNPGAIYMPQDEFKLLKKNQRRERVDAFLKTLDDGFVAANAEVIFARVNYLLE